MPRRTFGDKPMTNAERQARYRAPRAAAQTSPTTAFMPSIRRRTRPQRWRAAVAELGALQAEYAAWLDHLPKALRDGATGETLQTIPGSSPRTDLDLDDLVAIEPPRGDGRTEVLSLSGRHSIGNS